MTAASDAAGVASCGVSASTDPWDDPAFVAAYEADVVAEAAGEGRASTRQDLLDRLDDLKRRHDQQLGADT